MSEHHFMRTFEERIMAGVDNSDVAETRRQLAKKDVIIRIQKAAIDRWVPCPDHRDKISAEDGCQVCRRENAERALKRVTSIIHIYEELGESPEKILSKIKSHVERSLKN